MTHQEGSGSAVPARPADTRSQSSLVARRSQEEALAEPPQQKQRTLCHGPLCSSAGSTKPHGRTKGVGGSTAQHRPHHRRGPTQCGPQRAGPGHPAEAPCQPHAWPTRHAAKQQPAAPQGNGTKRCDRDSSCAPSSASSPAQAVAEIQPNCT
jgi:hypothetical protein